MYGWRKRLNSSRMISLWVLMLISLAVPASVPAGIISLEELLDITEGVPRRRTPVIDAAIFGINFGTSWSDRAFQDDPSVPARTDDNHGLEVLERGLIPCLEFSNIDQQDLKQLEIELRFLGSKK